MYMYANMKRVFSTYLLGVFVIYVEGSVTITVPAAGNCGDDTVLTCQVTGSIVSTIWNGLNRTLITNGSPTRPEDSNKYTETRGTSSFTLTIHNTDLTDEGEYRCANGFDESQLKRLNIECKASAADVTVTNGKKVSITVDKLYPSSPTFSASFKKENTEVPVAGSRTCSSSTQYSGYYRCVWSSSNSLADGSYSYSIIVTTITQAAPLTGSFKIVSAKAPVILNTSTLDDNRIVLYGNEGQPLTIQCTSTGGYPMPTVAWYKDSVSSSNQLTSSSSGSLQNDGTYTVTLSHTFTPTATDDKKTLICRSYYPQADSAYRGSKTTTVMLYLRLKPSQPTITQVSSVSSGGIVEVRCTTTGSRPAATIFWSYQGSISVGQPSNKIDNATETYTVQSTFRRQVTAADNGREVECVVTHPTLVNTSEIKASINLNVQLSPKAPVILNTSTLVDNRIVLYGNEGQPLTIQCTSNGGYPMPTVAWYKDSISNSNQLTSSSSGSQNNGTYTVTLSHTFTPTATDDKKTLICRSYYPQADSAYRGSETTTVMLYLRLKPSQPTLTQASSVSSGGTVEVRCTTTGSRPAATITWSYQGSTIPGQESNKKDNATETYTVQSTFRRQVTAADNGREVQCVVTHPTLVSPSERTASINLNVQSYFEEKNAVAGAVGGASAGLIIIALVIIVVVMYRRKSCTKEKLRDAARKIRRKKTSTDENKIEMSSHDIPVGVYEQLQRSEERGNRYLYDSLEVTTDNKHVYENLEKEAKATVHKAAPRDDNRPTYENL